jgi:CIC family chloride channel protein
MVFGWQPLFTLPPELIKQLSFNDPAGLLPYVVLAIFMAVLAMLYTRSFYGLTHLFHKIPIRPHFKPAIGAFLTGVLGLGLYYSFGGDGQVMAKQALSVMSFGYGVLQDGMTMTAGGENSFRLAAIMLAVAIGKILTTGLTIGSGGSGGVFGPSMVIGGCAGGALGIFFHWLGHKIGWVGLAPHPASFIIVGMAGFFAAAAKTPFSTLVMVGEMTGNYNLLLPTLWVCAVSFLLSDEQSIYSSQVASRSLSPAHQGDYVRDVLVGLHVRQFLAAGQDIPTLRPGDQLPEIVKRFNIASYHALPVTDTQGRLLGVVGLEEVLLASQSKDLSGLVVAADLMQSDIVPLIPEDLLDRALELFVESDLLALPVVDGLSERRVIGVVKRADISSTYLRLVHGTAEVKGVP